MEEQKLEKEIGRDLEALALKLKALSEARGEREVITWGPIWGDNHFFKSFWKPTKKEAHIVSSETSCMVVFAEVKYRREGYDYRLDVSPVSPGEVFHSHAPGPYYYVASINIKGLGMDSQFAYGQIKWIWEGEPE